MSARIARLLAAFTCVAALGVVAAAQDAPAQKADTASSEKTATRDLPLEPTRTISFETSEGSWISLDVAPDGQTIVFELLGDLYTLPMAGGAATRITSGMAFDSQPRFSPDGARIVFISDRSGDDNLWTVKADGSDAKALTKGKNQTYMSPEWTLDPNYIVATRSSGQAGMQLWLYHVDGGSGVQLTGNAESQRQLNPVGAAFGKDPRYIWFTERTAAGSVYNQMSFRWQLAVYDRQTGEVFRRSDELGSAMRPVLSPDGKWLVYATRHDAQTGLRLRDLETGDNQWLAYPVQRDDQESRATRDLMPGSAFTPDSSALITSFDGKIMRVEVPSGKITPIPFTAKVEKQLGPKLEFDYPVEDDGPVRAQQIRHPVLSPDGSKLAFTAFNRLHVMDYPNGTPRRLTDASVGEHQPNWSPDGRHILYVTWSDEDAGHVRRVPAAGGPVETLTTVPSFYSDPIYSPDGARIVVVRGPRVERMEDFSSSGTGGQGLDLMWMPAAGGALTRIAPHRGGAPHFGPEHDRLYVWEGRNGLVSFRFDGTDRREHVKVTGYRAPGAQQANQASAARISPDGRYALVEAERHLYVVSIPVIGGDAPTISVANPESASVPVRRLTRVGGEFGRWTAKGDRATWAIGRAFFDYDIPAARAAEEKDRLAKAAAGQKPDATEKPEPAAGEERAATGDKPEGEEAQKKPTPPVYDATETEITVTMPRPKPGGSVVLRGARIITMKDDEIIENGDVVITGNRIAAVGAQGAVTVPPGAQVIDVAGKTIMPGLVDVHAHIRAAFGVHRTQVWEYLANLAYGVTTTRDPQTASTDVVTYRDLVEAGMMLGPRIYHTGPGVFSRDNVQSLEEARDVLRRYSTYWDTKTIKQYMAGNRQQRQWIAMAAREQQLMPTLEGGLDLKLNLTQIIDGYAGLEHSLPIVPLYKDVVELVAQSGIVYTPTLLVLYGGPWAENFFYEEGDIHDDEKLRRFTPHARLDEAVLRRPWFHPQEYAHPMHAKVLADIVKAGGRVGLGGHGQRQGIGVHWELWAIASGGMAPHEALKVATIVGAGAIGLDKDLGSIEPGKLADLMVLDRNPIEDIRHTNTIRYVMMNGSLFEGETLDMVWPEKTPLPRQYWWDTDPTPRTGAPDRPWIRRE
jgi:Tol biopolymer transport system component